MPAILFSADLMLQSKFSAAGARTEIATRSVLSAAGLIEHAPGAQLVVIDLSTPRLEIVALVAELRGLALPPRSIVAFGPHVQTGLLEQAQSAPCDLVLSRGAFHAQLDELLRQSASHDERP